MEKFIIQEEKTQIIRGLEKLLIETTDENFTKIVNDKIEEINNLFVISNDAGAICEAINKLARKL